MYVRTYVRISVCMAYTKTYFAGLYFFSEFAKLSYCQSLSLCSAYKYKPKPAIECKYKISAAEASL